MGTCMQCWGTHCEKRSKALRCIVQNIGNSAVTKVTCENAGRTWLVHDWCRDWETCHGECLDLHPSVVDAATCFQRNVDFNSNPSASKLELSCTNTSKVPDWARNEIARRSTDGQYHEPKYYFGRGHCSKGCYRAPTPPSGAQTCATGSYYIGGANVCCKDNFWYDWSLKSCRKDGNCDDLSNEVQVFNDVTYEPAKYLTEDECNMGTCTGSFRDLQDFSIWSKEDCKAYSKPYCDRSCPKCVALGRYDPSLENNVGQTQPQYNSTGTTTYPSNGNGVTHIGGWDKFEWVGRNGACFDSSNKLVTDERYVRDKVACENVDGLTWYSCEEQPWNSSCATSLPTTIQNVLKCKAGGESGHWWESCPTEELCGNAGECRGHGSWDYGSARGCNEPNWEFGASHWGRKFETTSETIGTGNTAQTVSIVREVHKYCSDQRWGDEGVCVDASADLADCPEWLRHPKGCRVDAPWENVNGREQQNRTHCEVVLGNAWFSPLRTPQHV